MSTVPEMTNVWDASLLDGVAAPSAAGKASKLRDESGYTVRVHDDFLEWYWDDLQPQQKKRAQYCLRELLVRGECSRKKHVQGAAKGWIRSTLGGTGGSHFYLWWAPYGFPAVDGCGLEKGEILVRAVRHHDDTDKPLDAGGPEDWNLLRADQVHDGDDSELNEAQEKVAAPDGPPIRLVRGYPGSGKTTALHHAGSHVWGDRVLYLTFSSRLAQDTMRYFQRFAPLGTTIDALTFGELMNELGDGPPASMTPGARGPGGEQLVQHLHLVKAQLGPWADRPQELYAELHAHAVGCALPVEFREVAAAAGPVVDEAALVDARADHLGEKAARAMAFAARYLADEGHVDGVFPVLRSARRLVDRSAEALPPRFDGVAAVFVDEVQDLTVVEATLLLTVVARIGHASGTLPHLILAGDEAQTVRPTAFEWAWLRDLITLVLGKKRSVSAEADISLAENMRSSRAISLVIEATRSHYKLLPKEERPGGQNYDEQEVETEGKVLYCHVPTEEGWADVGHLFATHASAQLVYPGASVPDRYRQGIDADVAASEQVKGLDFDLVGVVGAGAKHAEIEALAAKADEDQLAGALGRNIADQFRVAVSRSRENLVLLDHGPVDHIGAIRSLMDAADPDPVMVVDVAKLREELDDESNPIERLDGQLDNVEEILDSEPERALQKARGALALRDSLNDVPAPMAAKAARLFGIAAALVSDLRALEGDVAQSQRLASEAAKSFADSDLAAAYATVRSIVHSSGDAADISPSDVIAGLAVYPEVLKELSPLEPALKASLHHWVDAVAASGLRRGADLAESLEATELAVELFPARPDFEDRRRDAIRRTAELAQAAGHHGEALQCFEELGDGHEPEMAVALEQLGRHDEALVLYQQLGDHAAVYRCARQIPDLDRALALAPEHDPEAVGRLRWAVSLRDMVDPALTDEGAALTEAERDQLAGLVADGVGRAVDAVAVDDAAVDQIPSDTAPVEAEPVDDQGPASPEPDADDVEAVADEPPPEEAESVPAPEVPAPQPAPMDVSGLVTLASVATEMGVTEAEAAAVCKKLGIRLLGDDQTMNEAQAGRLRRRIETHGVD